MDEYEYIINSSRRLAKLVGKVNNEGIVLHLKGANKHEFVLVKESEFSYLSIHDRNFWGKTN